MALFLELRGKGLTNIRMKYNSCWDAGHRVQKPLPYIYMALSLQQPSQFNLLEVN